MLLVGYIALNDPVGTPDGIDGSITIKAFFDKDVIAISDTYDGTESDNNGTTNEWVDGRTILTTAEWNALQNTGISFKIKVEANEGIWVVGSLEEIMKKTTVMDNINSTYVNNSTPGIDFGAISSDTNGKGVYTRAGTENDDYPIMYYRGDVTDNNVVFANKCWKTVRTTDTGGVKLVYNGEYSSLRETLSYSDYEVLTNTGNFVFDSTDNTWTATIKDTVGSYSNQVEISFNVPNGGGYTLEIYGTLGTQVNGVAYLGVSGTYSSIGRYGGRISMVTSFSRYFSFDNHTFQAGDSIKVTYYGVGTNENATVLKFRLTKPNDNLGLGCDEKNPRIFVEGQSIFPFAGSGLTNSPAYVGYMYGNDVYISTYGDTVNTADWTTNARFGSSFTWDGTNYTLVGDTVTTPDATHHYSCNSALENGTCAEIRYAHYFFELYSGGFRILYIILTGGVGIEEALDKMNINARDSNVKHIVDTWYANNVASYTNMFEDTVWCNDRSIAEYHGWSSTGTATQSYYSGGHSLNYGSYGRSNWDGNTTSSKNHPTLVCVNKNDRFTVNNSFGNMALTYPMGLLTADEVVFAGGINNYANYNYFLANEFSYTMSPWNFDWNSMIVTYGPGVSDNITDLEENTEFTICPAISLKPGQLITKGTGTETDPYVIE